MSKRRALFPLCLLSAFAIETAATHGAFADKPGVAKKASALPQEKTNMADSSQQLLAKAMETMGQLTSYHAKALLVISQQTANIEGDFGVGVVRFDTKRVDGKFNRSIVVGSNAYVSADGGKTWKNDNPQTPVLLSRLITAPLSVGPKIATGPVKEVGKEDIEGVATTHVQVQVKSPVDVWIADDAKLGKVVRKIHIITTADDGVVDTTVIYSALNQPVNIVAPQVK